MDDEARDYDGTYYKQGRGMHPARAGRQVRWIARGQRYVCPTCKREGALSAWQQSQGYQCDRCADVEERGF